jgi:hypothetical protein
MSKKTDDENIPNSQSEAEEEVETNIDKQIKTGEESQTVTDKDTPIITGEKIVEKLPPTNEGKKIILRKAWRWIKNFALFISIVAGLFGIYKNYTEISSLKDKLQNIKLFFAVYETGSDVSDYHGEDYQVKPHELVNKEQFKELNLNLALIHDTEKGANLPADNIRVSLRCDECIIDAQSAKIDRLEKIDDRTENNNQSWKVFYITRHAPPASLRFYDVKISVPSSKSEIKLLYRIEADSTKMVDENLTLKMSAQ